MLFRSEEKVSPPLPSPPAAHAGSRRVCGDGEAVSPPLPAASPRPQPRGSTSSRWAASGPGGGRGARTSARAIRMRHGHRLPCCCCCCCCRRRGRGAAVEETTEKKEGKKKKKKKKESNLPPSPFSLPPPAAPAALRIRSLPPAPHSAGAGGHKGSRAQGGGRPSAPRSPPGAFQIGRASCRERV